MCCKYTYTVCYIGVHNVTYMYIIVSCVGGYERFSAEYPFLRTQKILYTPLVNSNIHNNYLPLNVNLQCLIVLEDINIPFEQLLVYTHI